MEALHKTYKIRPGTKDLGREYEYNMVALLSVRCLVQKMEDMWIVSNTDEVGAFDDVILRTRPAGGNDITFMIQLKHKENGKNIVKAEFLPTKLTNDDGTPTKDKGDFSVTKYLKDIAELKQKTESQALGIVKDVGAFDTINFVLFTNRGVYPYEFLDKDSSSMSSLLNTNNADVYKFDFTKLTSSNTNLSMASDTCSKLFLFPYQSNAKQVHDQVVVEIRKIFDSLGITQINAKVIVKDFIDYVTNWAKGNFGEHYYLTKQEAFSKLNELFFGHFEVNLNKEQFISYDCPKKLIWNEIVQDKELILIDSDNTTLQFLFEYIGSEVKKYCTGHLEDWIDDISEEDRNSLFQPVNKHFKQQLLKVVGRHGQINALDVYRCLYMIKKLPLLVTVNKLQDYENILRVLKFSENCFKIIIVNKCELTLSNPATIESFCALQDLSQVAKNKILELPVKLQGRDSVVLGTLVDDEICKYIKCRDVIDILLNNFNIGNVIKTLPKYFIRRSISKVLIHPRVLQNSNADEIFLVEENAETPFNRIPIRNKKVFKYEDIDLSNSKGAFLVRGLENATQKQKEKLKSKGRIVHYFSVYDSNCLEWKWSLGSIKNLIPFRINTHDVFDNAIEQHFSNAVNIISATPGMGKTVLMDYIAHQAPTSKWVLRIDLNTYGYREYYRYKRKQNSSTESFAHLRYFNNHQLNKNNCNSKLVQMVFEKLLITKDVIVILDGFDEVSFSFKDEVTNIAKSLYHDGYQIWLTTRPHMASYLENEFNVFSLTLKPFDPDDKKSFLTEYFRSLNPDLRFPNKLLNQFVDKLLQAARNNLNDRDAEFTGIPLQSKLLADVFNDDCKQYLCNNTKSKFNEHFDLLYLYQNLIDKKIDILCEKSGSGTEAEMRSMFKDHQSLFAYKLLFPLQCLEGSYVEKLLRENYGGKQSKLALLQRDGIITVDDQFNVSCVHQTFAEYLLAQFMSENLSNTDENIAEVIQDLFKARFSGSDTFLFEVFDRILAKDCLLPQLNSLHLAIINEDRHAIKSIINNNPNIISEVDRCGRSVLHMITLYSAQFPMPYDPDYQAFKRDDMPQIINAIADEQIKKIKDDVFGYSPLDYAISNCALHVANVICDKSNTSTTNVILNLHEDLRHEFLYWAAELNFKSLFKILLPFFVSRDVLLSRDYAILRAPLEEYIDSDLLIKYNKGLRSNEKISKEMTILELLQSKIGNSYSGYSNNYYANLCFAIVLGTNSNLDNILSNPDIDINRKDFNLCTPLHYATLHGKRKIVKALLMKGAKIDAQGIHKNTALYFAALGYKLRITNAKLFVDLQGTAEDYYDIIVTLVKKGANINIQNESGATPLHCILNFNCGLGNFAIRDFDQQTKMKHLEIVRLLISNGADINMSDREDCSALYIAAENIVLDECVMDLLKYGADVNKTDSYGYSPLQKIICMEIMLMFDELLINTHNREYYVPIQDKKEKIVREMIARGANINQQNDDGETALHVALFSCEISHCRDAKVLLENEADVNIQDHNGNTPLHMAIIQSKLSILYHENIIELILNQNIDADIQNYDGNTLLHLISGTIFSIASYQVTISLLNRGANINIKNRNRESVLEVAYKSGNLVMICRLYCYIVKRLFSLYPDFVIKTSM